MKAWTPEEIAAVRELWDRGVTVKDIARQFDRSTSSIIGKAHALSFPPHPYTRSLNKGGRPRKHIVSAEREGLTDPNRADKLLRRWSWQEGAA